MKEQRIKDSISIIENFDKRYSRIASKLKFVLVKKPNTCYLDFNKMTVYWSEHSFFHSSLIWIASGILHETHHVIQRKRGVRKKKYNSRLETGAYKKQREFLKFYHADKQIKRLDRRYKEKWWEDQWYPKNKGITS